MVRATIGLIYDKQLLFKFFTQILAFDISNQILNAIFMSI